MNLDLINKNKFADIAIPEMVREMERRGCTRANMVAKIAGGAHMFPGIMTDPNQEIGKRNTEAVKIQLAALNIKLLAFFILSIYFF
jgi:chemotaxis protein CheD